MPQTLTNTVAPSLVTPQNILKGLELFAPYEASLVAAIGKLYPDNALIQEIVAINPTVVGLLPQIEAFLSTLG